MAVVRAASWIAPASESKVARSLRARRGLLARWEADAARHRDAQRPLVWFHAPSVGEGLQARPVAQALRAAHPTVQQAYSFFSPSAERFAATVGAELSGYLPFDTDDAADRLLDALRPAALVFVKLDVWPVLVARAKVRGVPVALLSATLSASSGRRGVFSRALLHDAYAQLDAVGAIDASHADRLVELGVRRGVIEVMGDTRFDQVAERAQRADRSHAPLSLLRSARPTVVAGSTWPADDAVLLPAWEQLRQTTPDARLIVAPHEPTAAHLAPITAWAARAGLTLSTLSGLESRGAIDTADVVLVDRVGVLGDLYALANCAFVGGGFHAAGLHSVIEPAAFGVPVLFGPGHEMSREAGLLLAAGAARTHTDAATLAASMTEWLSNGGAWRSAGARGAALVDAERGATARAVAIVERLIGLSPQR
jgi:3-deoxy-D-manno-octulosonic-acid transferase